ncbi:MAG: cell division protein ZapA [Christensenellaceae bacterium]|nr:cell division protein ZapA [Christensenellaceae bacterium]
MAETKTKITVYGKEYTIVSPDSRDHVQRVAAYLDDKIKELKSENLDISGDSLLTLAALNIADEFIKAQDKLEMLSSEVEGLRDMARDIQIKRQVEKNSSGMSAADRVRQLEEENAELKKRYGLARAAEF